MEALDMMVDLVVLEVDFLVVDVERQIKVMMVEMVEDKVLVEVEQGKVD